jgi:hypothetical protein
MDENRECDCVCCLHWKECSPADKLYYNDNGKCSGYADIDFEIDYELSEDGLYSWERFVDTGWNYVEDERE